MNLEQLIKSCVEARKTYERAEVSYFEFLSDVERDHVSIWKPACGAFTSFLESYVGLPRPSRYVEFREAVDKLTIDRVREIGIDAAVISLRASSKSAQKEYEEEIRSWVKKHDGVHPSPETARNLLGKVDPRPRPKPPEKTELELLREERDKLKRELHKLERENEKLKAESAKLQEKNASLQAKLRAKKPGARTQPTN